MTRSLGSAAAMFASLLVMATLVSSDQVSGQAPATAAGAGAAATLDFDYFRARVQPIFTTKRAGNACATRFPPSVPHAEQLRLRERS